MFSAAISEFWGWFTANEEFLFNASESSNELFEEISVLLAAIHEDLGFEMTLSTAEDGKREFVVSAGGLLGAYQAVCDTVAYAPTLERWRIVAFKPRKQVDGYLRIEELQVALDGIKVGMRQFGAYVACTVYFSEFNDDAEQVFGEAAFILLDLVLGEADVLKSIGPVEVGAIGEEGQDSVVSLRDLSVEFDRLCRELQAELVKSANQSKVQRRNRLRALHKSTVELLEESIKDDLKTCGLRLRYFCQSEFAAETLKESIEGKWSDSSVVVFQAPSLRGQGWVTAADVTYRPETCGAGMEYLEQLLGLGLDCDSELDLIQYTDVQISAVVRSLPKLNACLQYHQGNLDQAWTILDEAQDEYVDDIDYWSLLAYLSAKTGKISRFSDAFRRLEELFSEEEDELSEELIGPLWQLACACALVGESEQTCALVEQILTIADPETSQEIRQELNESEDLALIRSSPLFINLQSRIGSFH